MGQPPLHCLGSPSWFCYMDHLILRSENSVTCILFSLPASSWTHNKPTAATTKTPFDVSPGGVMGLKDSLNQIFISHASKVMLKIPQVRLQQYMNQELQMFKLDLEKAEEPEIKLPIYVGSSRKQEGSRKTSALLTRPKPLIVQITKKLENS